MNGGSPYRVSLVYTDTDGNSTANELIRADGTFIPSKADTNHASTGTNYGLGTTGYYGHVKLYNALTQSSYTDGYALSANQGYILNNKLNLLRFEASTDDGYQVCNVTYSTTCGVTTFLLCIGTEIYSVLLDTSYQYSVAGTDTLTGDYTYKYQISAGMGNYSDTILSYINAVINSQSDDTGYNIRIKFKFNYTNVRFVIYNIRGFDCSATTNWVSS